MLQLRPQLTLPAYQFPSSHPHPHHHHQDHLHQLNLLLVLPYQDSHLGLNHQPVDQLHQNQANHLTNQVNHQSLHHPQAQHLLSDLPQL